MTMSKKKFAIITAIIFFLGIGFGAAGDTKTVEKEVVKEVPVEKVVEANDDTWRKLKSIDDEAFIVAGEQMQLCSAGFYAASNFDAGTMEAVAADMKVKTTKMTQLGTERQKVLRNLGY